MVYQIIKHNKSGSRTLYVRETLSETKGTLKIMGLNFREIYFMGGFPLYTDDKGKIYSVQGGVKTDIGSVIVCSIPKEEVEALKQI